MRGRAGKGWSGVVALLLVLAVLAGCDEPADETQGSDGATDTPAQASDESATDDDPAETDGEPAATDDEPAEYDQDMCDDGTGPCGDSSDLGLCDGVDEPCVQLINNSTCHNFQAAGGNSDDRVFGRVFNIAPNSNVIVYFDVTENLAAGADDERTAGDFVNEDGSLIFVLPAFGVGETYTLTDVVVAGVSIAPVQDFDTSIAPLDDPETQCDELPAD